MKHAWDRRLGFWWIAQDLPDQPAVASSPSGVTLTYGELAGRYHQLVHGLRASGLGAGDIVAYALPNDIDMLYWQLALQEGGFQAIALNPAPSGGEIQRTVDHSGAAAIVIHTDYADRVKQMAGTGSIQLRVSVGGAISGWTPYDELVDGHVEKEPEDRVLGVPISYSSGTTGQPKAITRPSTTPIDPYVMADRMKLFGHAFQFQPLTGAQLVSAGMHHGGCQSFYFGALNVRQSIVILGKFDAEQTLAAIDRFRITCPLEVKRQMMEWWGPVIWETYGGMEGAATIAKPHRWLEKPGTVGRAVAGIKVKILDDDGNQLSSGQIGNVYLEPEFDTFEHRNEPELTASVRRGRAFTLGDVGYLDSDGYLFLRVRAKDMIISGGVNIYPAEVEGVLSEHPLVGDVAVIGIPDPEWGEQVKAVVELVRGAQASDELGVELIAFCRARISGYKCPRSVDFTDGLPRTDGGKLYKRLLRNEYRSGVEGKV